MKPALQRFLRLTLVLVLCVAFGALAHGQVPAISPGTNVVLPAKNPVDGFRELLAMKGGQREEYLASRPSAIRAQLEKKLQEYEAMKPEDREAKLAATQLHWYLEQFILTPSANRGEQLKTVPPPYREILKQRLAEFDLLPPPLQKEMLEHETTRTYFLGRSAAANRAMVPQPPVPALPAPLKGLGRLPAEQRGKMYASFHDFFGLPDGEKQKVLDTLSIPERRQAEKTLKALESLPKHQRDQGLQSLDKLVTLTEEQRQVFFRNAGRWKEMSPTEREAWLKLVSHLPPMSSRELLPPPPMLAPAARRPEQFQATNPPVP